MWAGIHISQLACAQTKRRQGQAGAATPLNIMLALNGGRLAHLRGRSASRPHCPCMPMQSVPAQQLASSEPLLLDDIRVVLVAPKLAANIGATARACANFEVRVCARWRRRRRQLQNARSPRQTHTLTKRLRRSTSASSRRAVIRVTARPSRLGERVLFGGEWARAHSAWHANQHPSPTQQPKRLPAASACWSAYASSTRWPR